MKPQEPNEFESVELTESMKAFDKLRGAILAGDRDAAAEVFGDASVDEEAFRVLSGVSMFLSLLFRYPEQEVYTAVAEHLDHFDEFIEEYTEDTLAIPAREELEPAYVKLFVNDINGVAAVPYASAHTDREGLLMRESTVELKKLMGEHGFSLAEGVKEIEDHVYIMMEFVSNMFERVADAEEPDEQLDSLRPIVIVFANYLAPMVDSFSDKIEKADAPAYYKAAAQMLNGFVGDFDSFMTEVLFEENDDA